MKKILLFLFLIPVFAAAQKTTGGNYTYIAQRYEDFTRLFQALNLPAGDSAQHKPGQDMRQGAVYLDTVNTASSPAGYYIYKNGIWELQGGGFFSPDQTSTGATTHNANGNNFTLDNVDGLTFNSQNTIINSLNNGEFLAGARLYIEAGDSIRFTSINGIYNFQNVIEEGDTTLVKPFGWTASGGLRRVSFWPGSGGGGSDLVVQPLPSGGTDVAIVVPRNDTLFHRLIATGYNFILVDTLSDGRLRIRVDTADANLKSYIAQYSTGTIGGSIADNQIAVGDGANTISGSSSFTNDGTTITHAATAQASTAEELFKASVSDDASGYLRIANSTSAASTFSPLILGNVAVNNSQAGLSLVAQTTAALDNSAATALFIFDARRSTPAALTQRPLFQFKNFGTNNLEMAAGGQLGIGITGPTEWLQIRAGTTGAAPIRLTPGTNLTTARTGAIEYDGNNFFMTALTATRRQVVRSNVATPGNGQIPIGNGTDFTLANITAGSNITVTNTVGGIEIASTASGMANPMTTSQDIIVGGASGTPTRLAVGTNGQRLGVSGGNVTWVDNDATWNGLFLQTLQTSSTSVTLSTHGLYTYVGSADATFTLPALSSNLNRMYFIKNSSAFNVTVQRAGSDDMFTTTTVTSITIPAGSSRMIGGTTASGTSYWHVMDLSEGTGSSLTRTTGTTASSATPAPTGDAIFNTYTVTALATNATFGAPTGTPVDQNEIRLRITDNGTSRTLAWNAIYDEGADIALPTATVVSETIYLAFVYNSATSKWQLIGKTGGF